MKSQSQLPVPVTATTIAQALAESDDFGHEMRVHALLRNEGASVLHGWTYLDPLEQKPRQFDLRATLRHPQHERFLQMAIECKNLSSDAPLIVSGVPRTKAESFHDFVVSDYNKSYHRVSVMRCSRDSDLYRQSEFVGKSLLRLRPGKGEERGRLVSTSPLETEIYQRWSQALASADEVCKKAAEPGRQGGPPRWTVILPVVVLPDGALWTVEYDADGNMQKAPALATGATFFVNHEVVIVPHNHWTNLSHVHFFTLCGFRKFLADMSAPAGPWEDWFPASAEQHRRPVP